MKDYPMIPAKLVDKLKESFSDSVKYVKTLEDLQRVRGQQEVISHLESISDQQTKNKGGK